MSNARIIIEANVKTFLKQLHLNKDKMMRNGSEYSIIFNSNDFGKNVNISYLVKPSAGQIEEWTLDLIVSDNVHDFQISCMETLGSFEEIIAYLSVENISSIILSSVDSLYDRFIMNDMYD